MTAPKTTTDDLKYRLSVSLQVVNGTLTVSLLLDGEEISKDSVYLEQLTF